MSFSVDPQVLSREIVRMMQDFSIEVMPAELAHRTRLPADLAPGSRVYVPWIVGQVFEPGLRAVVRLRELGLTPVPHIAARAIPDARALDHVLGQLAREAQVDQALLVAGSQRQAQGSYDNTLQLLASGLFEQHGWKSLALAAHPEGSPDILADALARALLDKNSYAGNTQIALRLVTQFCFAAGPLVDWEQQARVSGNRLPVHVGLAGLASLPTLLRYARSCGVGASIGALTHQSGRLLQLASGLHPGEIMVALARARLGDPLCRVERIHLFPFGSLDATVAWAAAVARGEFKLCHDGTDIKV